MNFGGGMIGPFMTYESRLINEAIAIDELLQYSRWEGG